MGTDKSYRLPKQALVTGATGAVGPALVQLLLQQGIAVRVLGRRGVKNGRFSPTIDYIQGDITDPVAVETAVAGCDTIFHLAAKLHINNPNPTLLAEYRRVNVEGTRLLVDAAQQAQIRRFVYFSTINVYGTAAIHQPFTEAHTPNPQDFYAQTKWEAEKTALSLHSPTGEPISVILRLAAVYGTNMKGNYVRVINAVQKGRFLPIGSGKNHRTLVFDQDVAQAALLAAQHPTAAGQIYNVTDGDIHTFCGILEAIYAALGKKAPPFTLPVAPLRLLLSGVEKGFRLAGASSPIGAFTIDKMQESIAVCGQKIQQELGFTPQYNLQQGWQHSVQALAT